MQPGRSCLWDSTKGPKRQISCEKFFTHFTPNLAPFSSRVSLMFSLFPGVMWKRKWDNAQSVLVTGLGPFEQHSAVTLTNTIGSCFPPKLAGRGPGISSQACCHQPQASWPPAATLLPFCHTSLLLHPVSPITNINYSFPPFLTMIPSNLCLALSHQDTARACPIPQPSQHASSGLAYEGSPASIAPADINFVLESQSQLRILWMKDQPQ